MSHEKYEQAPFHKYEEQNRPATDDAYAIGRTPIKVDLRVPAFLGPLHAGHSASGNAVIAELDRTLYNAGLSIPDLNLLIRGSSYAAHGHYRGEEFKVDTGSATLWTLFERVRIACDEIDALIGGIRLVPEPEGSKCGFTLRGKTNDAPFDCPRCGSREFRLQLTMTANADPSYSAPDGTRPIIRGDMDVYAVSVQCKKCGHAVPGSGYTHE